MLVVSDTHREAGHGLPPGALEYLRTRGADGLVHAGDLTTGAVLDAFRDLDAPCYAVYGNADGPVVWDRLPSARTLDVDGLTVAVTHTRRGGAQGLSLFGREHDADLVVCGHTHEPTIVETAECTLLNPGSHTGRRAARATYATVDVCEEGAVIAIHGADGEVIERARIDID